eukprot:1194516-Prorocentrum_minimum.AAC.3
MCSTPPPPELLVECHRAALPLTRCGRRRHRPLYRRRRGGHLLCLSALSLRPRDYGLGLQPLHLRPQRRNGRVAPRQHLRGEK